MVLCEQLTKDEVVLGQLSVSDFLVHGVSCVHVSVSHKPGCVNLLLHLQQQLAVQFARSLRNNWRRAL